MVTPRLATYLRRATATMRSVGRGKGPDPYADRIRAETSFFANNPSEHELPRIYHYWSNTFLRPKLETLGFSHPEEMFSKYISAAYVASKAKVRHFISIGSGSCETEVALAKGFKELGHTEFLFECVELNEELLVRGRSIAQECGVEAHMSFTPADANQWTPGRTYDAVLANSSLHHIVNLENLFEGIERSLAPTGIFVTSDMIGRNGHMRWPEALAIVEEFWRELPRPFTYNHLLRRYERIYDNWDCSTEGFEGIRAQDILPLLIRHFDFDVFVAFANVVDPFIDRGFGPNFDPANPRDIDFINRVHARDELEIARGEIKPTHILAAMCVGRPGAGLVLPGLTPRFCVRSPICPPKAFADRSDRAAEVATPAGFGDLFLRLEILPDCPKSFEPLFARIHFSGDRPPGAMSAQVHRTKSEIVVELRQTGTNGPADASFLDVGIGQYPEGPLTIVLTFGSTDRLTVSTQVLPRPTHGPHPMCNYTDVWWNPLESGWGLGIHQHPTGLLVAIWHVYDDAGMPCWYCLQPGAWTSETRFEGPIFRYQGPRVMEAFDPAAVESTEVGRGSLFFETSAAGMFSYQIAGLVGRKHIVRMPF